jgi:hypothetical protein
LNDLILVEKARSPFAGARIQTFAKSAALACILLSSACSAPVGAKRGVMEFQCDVKGTEKVLPAVETAKICAMIKERVDAALLRQTVGVKILSNLNGLDWVKVDVNILKRGGATALVSRKQGASEARYPEIRVDVMDKALGENELKMLASEVGKILSNRTEEIS